MGKLFKEKQVVMVNVDNKANPTSNFFAPDGYKTVVIQSGTHAIWTVRRIPEKINLNSKFLYGEISLDFQRLTRDANTTDVPVFQNLAFKHPGQMLEVAATLIREEKVAKKIDGWMPEVYVMFSEEMSVFFFNNMFGWNFYFNPREEVALSGHKSSMYDIGGQCTVVSLSKS